MSDELRQTPDAARLAARLQRCVISAQAFLICHCLYPALSATCSTRSAQNPFQAKIQNAAIDATRPSPEFGSHGSHTFTYDAATQRGTRSRCELIVAMGLSDTRGRDT